MEIKIKGSCYSDKTRFKNSYQYKLLRTPTITPHAYDLSYAYVRLLSNARVWARTIVLVPQDEASINTRIKLEIKVISLLPSWSETLTTVSISISLLLFE